MIKGNPKTFEDLVSLVEAPLAPIPVSTMNLPAGAATPGRPNQGAPGKWGGGLGNAMTKMGDTLAKFDPAKISAAVRGARQAGIIGATAQALQWGGKKLTKRAQRELEDYFEKLDLPKGWPKKGDLVIYVGIRFKKFNGMVDKVQPQGDNIVISIRFPGSQNPVPNSNIAGGFDMRDRYVTAVHNKKAVRPFYSLESFQMQVEEPGKGWIPDPDEAGHAAARAGGGTFKWNAGENKFEYNTDVKAPDTEVAVLAAFFTHTGAAVPAVGVTISNFTDIDNHVYPRGKVNRISKNGQIVFVKPTP